MKYQICFSASATVRKWLKWKSAKTGLSVSSLINSILKEYIENHKN